jgi:hypothetical protein
MNFNACEDDGNFDDQKMAKAHYVEERRKEDGGLPKTYVAKNGCLAEEKP